jgi:hypothetical protein
MLRVPGGVGVDEAILGHQLQVLGARDQAVEAAVYEALGHLTSGVPEAALAGRLGDDPDLRPVVLGGDTPGAVVTGADAGLAEEGGLGLFACVQHGQAKCMTDAMGSR